MRATTYIRGLTLWANLLWLFWITLIPFATAWMSEHEFNTVPVAIYGIILLMAAVSFFLLQHEVTRVNGPDSALSRAVARDAKARWSVGLYILALIIVPWAPWASCACYAAVAVLWFIPDQRFERAASR